jgi:hypothetical protein
MLTEARVILPGAQALLGFQLIVMLTKAFDQLPPGVRFVHLAALLSLVLAVALLIAPAAIHRLAFEGRDDPALHSFGSFIISLALFPLASSIALDTWVALFKLYGGYKIPSIGSALAALLLIGLWYLLPIAIRAHLSQRAVASRLH